MFVEEGIPGRTNTEGVRSSSKAGVPGKDEVNQLDGLQLTALPGQNSLVWVQTESKTLGPHRAGNLQLVAGAVMAEE